ncbi:hypothetical protein [Oceanobacillus kapialis]|uniref:hypothetical protein n=1 Tax=Oceanobacillus kapialis TaxID=481353 RepID=UPI00384C6AE7
MSSEINYTEIPSKEKVWAWQEQLNSFGPRYTGNEAHKRTIDFFEKELTQMGLEVYRDKHLFTKWETKKWSLALQTKQDELEKVPVSFYYPYSGETPSDGVNGELIYCGTGPGNFKKAAGKIAIVDVKSTTLPSPLFFKRRSSYPKNERMPLWITNPVVSSVLRGPDLEKAKQAGVLGVICVWKNISAENAKGQYLPFTTAHKDCPALWVDEETGNKIKAAARQQTKARLVLEAEAEESAESDSLYAILPGKDDKENILVNTHTDGPNACEENGGIGLLAMAEYFSKLPLDQRQRNLLFVFVTGHFQIPQFGVHGQATTRWLHDHPELWDGEGENQRAVAGLTLEHLGCLEWKDNQTKTEYQNTGNLEAELVYTGNDVMNNIYLKSLEGRTRVRSITLRPKNKLHFGEGHIQCRYS